MTSLMKIRVNTDRSFQERHKAKRRAVGYAVFINVKRHVQVNFSLECHLANCRSCTWLYIWGISHGYITRYTGIGSISYNSTLSSDIRVASILFLLFIFKNIRSFTLIGVCHLKKLKFLPASCAQSTKDVTLELIVEEQLLNLPPASRPRVS